MTETIIGGDAGRTTEVRAVPRDAPGQAAAGQVDADALQLLSRLLREAVSKDASDIHLRVGNHPIIRIDGQLHSVRDYPRMSVSDMEHAAKRVMSPRHWDAFQERLQVDFSIGLKGIGRVRVNAYFQRGTIAMALRVIKTDVPTPAELKLPDVINECVGFERGLVLLTGATGSGKSTTIASLVNEINHNFARHIITIEDPIEFLFTERRSLISQRELGVDATGFADAMTAALREDPDVIFLGEMRDPVTIDTALTAAETGHLVFSTLHAQATAETVTRMISSFPAEAQTTIRSKLSQNLRMVVAQRLLPRQSGEGRVVACEVLTISARVRELILDPIKVKDINDLVKRGATVEGMLSFDRHLFELVRRGEITEDTALQHASSATDLKLQLDGFAS